MFEFIGKCFFLVKTTFQNQGIIISPDSPSLSRLIDISSYLELYFQELKGKEKEMLENEMKEKIKNRDTAINKAKKIKADLKV